MALNYRCVFPNCGFTLNDADEKDFFEHLDNKHLDEVKNISPKESIPINMAMMIAASNSSVFINPG